MYTLGAAVMVPASMGLLFTLNAPLAATMLLPLVLMGLGMKAFTPRLSKWSEAVQESIAELSSRAQENFSGIRIVKGYGREEQQMEKFDRASDINRDNQIALGRYPIAVQGGGIGTGIRYAAVFAGQDRPIARAWTQTNATGAGYAGIHAVMRNFMQARGVRSGVGSWVCVSSAGMTSSRSRCCSDTRGVCRTREPVHVRIVHW